MKISRKFNCDLLEARPDGNPGAPNGVMILLEVEFTPDDPRGGQFSIDGVKVAHDVFTATLRMLGLRNF